MAIGRKVVVSLTSVAWKPRDWFMPPMGTPPSIGSESMDNVLDELVVAAPVDVKG
jgi:hypothetical protein